jgi:hypothetical protein
MVCLGQMLLCSVYVCVYKTQSENNRESGSSWLRNNCVIYPRAKLWAAEATVTYCKTISGQLSAASVGVSCPKASVSSKAMPGLTQQMPPWWRCDTWSLTSCHTLLIPHTWRRLIFICLGHWKSPGGTQIELVWRCPVGGTWVAQGPTTRVLFVWHPNADFPLAQVHWTAGGLRWILSRYFLHCLKKPHCSTTFPVIFWLYLVCVCVCVCVCRRTIISKDLKRNNCSLYQGITPQLAWRGWKTAKTRC